MGSLEEVTAAEIDKHLQVNVRGTLLLNTVQLVMESEL
jgi:hypothetical protein